jgi:predicted nucleic acid-binding protein
VNVAEQLPRAAADNAGMTSETMIALALHTCRSRRELFEVAAELLAAASVAHAIRRRVLRDRLIGHAAELLATTADRLTGVPPTVGSRARRR